MVLIYALGGEIATSLALLRRQEYNMHLLSFLNPQICHMGDLSSCCGRSTCSTISRDDRSSLIDACHIPQVDNDHTRYLEEEKPYEDEGGQDHIFVPLGCKFGNQLGRTALSIQPTNKSHQVMQVQFINHRLQISDFLIPKTWCWVGSSKKCMLPSIQRLC
jgi:hypothetical protein